MALSYGFYNSVDGDRTYDAIQFGQIFDGIIKDGVYGTYLKGMVVMASENAGEVIIQPGRAWFNHTWSYNDANLVMQAPAPEVLLDRIDALVLDIASDLASRENSFKWVTGEPSSNPKRPELTNTVTHHQYPLCYVRRYPETTMIYERDITNMVGTSECPFATGVLEGIDLDAWIRQWDDEFHNWEDATKTSFESWMLTQQEVYTAWYNAIKGQMEGDLNDFESWFETIRGIIDEEAATHLQSEIDALAAMLPAGSHITITTQEPSLYLRNVTVTDLGGHSATAKFDSNGIAVIESFPYVGTLTVSTSDGERTASSVISAPYFGRFTTSLAFWRATLNFVCGSMYAGNVVTVKNSSNVPVGSVTLDASGNGTLDVGAAGTYTCTTTYGGKTMQRSVNVTQETTYDVSFIPDGSSVTPTDDIQTWLQCAGIFDKTYTTLDEVLADSTTLLALISDHNAVDYMARSHTWVKSDLVPVMTSNTTPSGVAFTTTDSSDAWKLFDNDDSTEATKASASGNQAAGYEFTTPQKVFSFRYYRAVAANYTLTIQYSDDGTTYQDAYTETMTSATEVTRSWQTDYGTHKYWRIYLSGFSGGWSKYGNTLQFYGKPGITNDSTAMSYIGANDYCADTLLVDSDWREGICYSDYFESVLNVKVPTMTSDTAPSGKAFSSSNYNSLLPFKAFDGNDASYWQCGDNHPGSAHVGYQFTNSIKVYLAYYSNSAVSQGATNNLRIFKIQASNDGENWVDLTDQISLGELNTSIKGDFKFQITAIESYSYYRMVLYARGSSNDTTLITIPTLQFYGRA